MLTHTWWIPPFTILLFNSATATWRSLPAHCVLLSSYNLSLLLSALLNQNEREFSNGQEILIHRMKYWKIAAPSVCWWTAAEQPAAWVVELVVVRGYWCKAGLHYRKPDKRMHSLVSLSLKAPRCRAPSQQLSSPPCFAQFRSHFALTLSFFLVTTFPVLQNSFYLLSFPQLTSKHNCVNNFSQVMTTQMFKAMFAWIGNRFS